MNQSSTQTTVEKLREKLIQTALDSPEFRELLKETVSTIVNYSRSAINEASVESSFDRELYSLLKNIGINLQLEKQIAVDTRRHIGKGRMDSRIGAVVIEYKHRGKLETDIDVEKATNQLKDYLSGLYQTKFSVYYGFLTDGVKCKEIILENNSVTSESALVKFTEVEALRLIKNVVLLEKTALSPENLIKDFCNSRKNSLVYDMSKTFFDVLKSNPTKKTRMLKTEWEQLFRLGHNDRSQQKMILQRECALESIIGKKFADGDQYTALFALQTAYAIIIKLIAYRIISELRFDKPLKSYHSILKADVTTLRIFCAGLEDGEIFRDLGIVNLLEGDFFSWYSDPEQWTATIANYIRSSLEILARYENASEVFKTQQAIDLFKGLYQTIMPQVVRSSLGEFYTPSWLTEHIFKCVKPQGKWRGLDPCVGSGTFVLTMIREVLAETSGETREHQLQEVLERVQAIDLNPLAVLTTRINYFIRISHLIPERPSHLQIPVYLGDACYVPERVQIDGVECLKYAIRTVEQQIEIIMPRSLVKDTQRFSDLMNQYEKNIKKEDFDGSIKLLIDNLPREEQIPSVLKELERLTHQLVHLENEKWNGIWARIMSNFLITAELGKFEVIIGNPPWIDWKNLPSGYRERIKSLCIDKNLFSGDGRTGGINLNVCALISSVSIENWLSDDGKLAFLMPKVIAFQQSYDGYRKFRFSRVPRNFLAFYDWSRAGHPFRPITERFMTFIIGPAEMRKEIMPVKCYVKKRGVKIAGEPHLSFNEAMSRLIEKDFFAGQVMPHNTAFSITDDISDLEAFRKIAGEPEYIGREGIEFYPQELFLFSLAPKPPTQSKTGYVYVSNLQFTKSVYNVPTETLELETEYLFPLVKSVEIERFKHNYSGVIVPFPYKKTSPKRPLDRTELQGTKLLDYFCKYEEVIRKQTEYYQRIKGQNSGEFYGMARVGPYSFAECYVAFRDSTKWRATVILPVETDWGGRKRFVFQNHAASICEDSKGNFITEDEAHYICAILNAPIVEKFILQSSDSRSFKIRPPIKIPKYDDKNEKHKQLSQLSRTAHINAKNIDQIRQDIEKSYLEILSDAEQKISPDLTNWT
jgi:hypothetical protein